MDIIRLDSRKTETLQDNLLPVTVFREIDSTNTYAKQALTDGRTPPFLVIAEKQTAGRGRRGHSFFSPDSGLYYTLTVRPDNEAEALVRTTIAAAAAVHKAILECTGIQTGIKWVNDLYLNRKKVCGILCEAPRRRDGSLAGIVIGIGINCSTSEFPEELKDIAGSLNRPDLDRNILAASITKHLMTYLNDLKNPEILDIYRSASILIGRPVSFIRDGAEVHGTAADINDNGELVVTTERGTEILSSGEISLTSWE